MSSINQKINAATDTATRGAYGISTNEPSDTSKGFKVIHWRLEPRYQSGKLLNFSIGYLLTSGKSKGNYIDCVTLTPHTSQAFLIKINRDVPITTKDAIAQFIKADRAISDINSLSLPPVWLVFCLAFDRTEIDISSDLEKLSGLKQLSSAVWQDVQVEASKLLPIFSQATEVKATEVKATEVKAIKATEAKPTEAKESIEVKATEVKPTEVKAKKSKLTLDNLVDAIAPTEVKSSSNGKATVKV